MRVTTRSLLASTCAFLMLGSSIAAAQTSRDEGIKALLRGNYVQAAQILRPLAEDAQPADHTAQFIMGMLYDGGFGGQGGTLRACAMYTAAAANPGPFAEPATFLARMIREELGRGVELCDNAQFRSMMGTATFTGSGRTSTATDAFTALARGEYAAAAALLQPIAESDVINDQGAQFLMATLYQSGRGAMLDPLRACALYSRASIADRSPFYMAATRLMQGLWRAHDNEWFAECQLLGNLGLDSRFEPVTFDLGPGHSVAFDLRGAVITYQGRPKRVEQRFAGRGAAFLPLRYTALRTGRDPAPLHFVEVAVWVPVDRTWSLSWNLFEVTRDELIHRADAAPLLTAETRPPASASMDLDLRTLVTLRTNDAGIVEWALTSDPQRHGTIESEEERRQTREDRAAREAAMAKVDWSQKHDRLRPPTLRYGIADGCGRLQLMAPAEDRAEWIRVLVSDGLIPAAASPRAIDIGRAADGVQVTVHLYEQPLHESEFCTDVGMATSKTVWRAISGTLTVSVSPRGLYGRDPSLYRATIRIDGAVFVSDTGQRLPQSAPIVLTALVSGAVYGLEPVSEK